MSSDSDLDEWLHDDGTVVEDAQFKPPATDTQADKENKRCARYNYDYNIGHVVERIACKGRVSFMCQFC